MAKIDDNGAVTIGLTSKFSDFACRYPWMAVLGIVVVAELVLICVQTPPFEIIRARWALLLLLGCMALLLQILTVQWCYKVTIDRTKDRIYFHRFFNRGTDSAFVKDISVVIGCHPVIVANGRRHVLHEGHFRDLMAHLPQDTPVEYAGWIGKYRENCMKRGAFRG